MEVHGRHAADVPAARDGQHRDRLQRADQAQELLAELSRQAGHRVHHGAKEAARRMDALDLSAATRPEMRAADEARARYVHELQREHRAGTLSSPERIERAAERLLGG